MNRYKVFSYKNFQLILMSGSNLNPNYEEFSVKI